MKSREGFVSNSSTSSFVIIGYKVNSIEEALKLFKPDQYKVIIADLKSDTDGIEDQFKYALSDVWYNISNDSDSELDARSDDGKYYIGKIVSEESECGMRDCELNNNDVQSWIDGVQKLTKSEDKPGLIVGTRCC